MKSRPATPRTTNLLGFYGGKGVWVGGKHLMFQAGPVRGPQNWNMLMCGAKKRTCIFVRNYCNGEADFWHAIPFRSRRLVHNRGVKKRVFQHREAAHLSALTKRDTSASRGSALFLANLLANFHQVACEMAGNLHTQPPNLRARQSMLFWLCPKRTPSRRRQQESNLKNAR